MDIKEEDEKKIKKFGELITKSMRNEHHLDIEKLDEVYQSIKESILAKNEEINEWYDDDYKDDIINLKKNMSTFSKSLNTNEDERLFVFGR
jgi:hypothetical protein